MTTTLNMSSLHGMFESIKEDRWSIFSFKLLEWNIALTEYNFSNKTLTIEPCWVLKNIRKPTSLGAVSKSFTSHLVAFWLLKFYLTTHLLHCPPPPPTNLAAFTQESITLKTCIDKILANVTFIVIKPFL